MFKTIPAYPALIPLKDYRGITDVYCYIVRHYGTQGLAVSITRSGGSISIKVGNWSGQEVNLAARSPESIIAQRLLKICGDKLVSLCSAIKLGDAIFYFATPSTGTTKLVDVQVAPEKFAGPGLVRDIFGSTVETQDVLEICHLDEDRLKSIEEAKGIYKGDWILKPSRFRQVTYKGKSVPLYIEITR